MLRLKMWVTMAILSWAGTVAGQPGGTLGVYADAAGTTSMITLPLYTPVDFYILGRPNVANLGGGLQGAEFRVKGVPAAGLLLQPVRSPAANIDLGNPFSDESLPPGSRGGCNIAFPLCQVPDANGFVLLYTVTALDVVGLSDIHLQVDRRDPPTNFNLPWPLFNACLEFFPAFQVAGLQAVINSTTVSVQNRSFGGVKALYR